MTRLALLVALVALVSCACTSGRPAGAEPSGADQRELEQAVLGQLRPEHPGVTPEVSCGGGLGSEPAATQECDLVSEGGRVAVRVRAGDDGDVDLQPFLRGDWVAAAVAGTLRPGGSDRPRVDCPDELVGRVGETVECAVALGGDTGTLTATVTKVDDLMIHIDVESR